MAAITQPATSTLPDIRPEMVRLSRKMLLAQLAEIQVLRGRRKASRTRPVSLHALLIKDTHRALKRRLANFRECYANHRALRAAIVRDGGIA